MSKFIGLLVITNQRTSLDREGRLNCVVMATATATATAELAAWPERVALNGRAKLLTALLFALRL